MSDLLHRLARHNDIQWLSYYFARFVCDAEGQPLDSILAYSAALVSEAASAGNVCLELTAFSNKPMFHSAQLNASLLPLGPDLASWIQSLKACSSVGGPGQHSPLILDGSRLYMNRYWNYEDFVAKRIKSLLQSRNSLQNLEVQMDSLFAGSIDMDAEQEQAVYSAAGQPFTVISGGPGSGKTSTVIRILALLMSKNPDYRIALAAPTGKAAARMMDSIRQRIEALNLDAGLKSILPLEAQTIHRLLGYRHGDFTYNQKHRLPVDCIIVDEASMIDLKLMYQLLAALPERARLILLGDRDQLASVAAGNVLADITGQGQASATDDSQLKQATRLLASNYRFGSDSAIGSLARQVNMGDASAALLHLQGEHPDIHWYNEESEQIQSSAKHWLLERYQTIFDSETPAQALQAYEQTRLLCATNHGPFGIETLNQQISAALLARNHLPASDLFAGLPIMISHNFHELELYNGDTGILWSIDGELRACFSLADGSTRNLAINRLPEFKPAWAITVHKSQGSEFDSVLLLLPGDAQNEALTRELLYTAITRARRGFLLHGSKRAISQAIQRLTQRHSGLAAKLGWQISAD